MKRAVFLALSLVLSGCAYQLTLMPRDGGSMYQGTATGDGVSGRGEMSVTIQGDTYQGTWTAVRDYSSMTLMNAYGQNNRGVRAQAIGYGTTTSAGSSGLALLRSLNNKGLRCEFQYGGYGTGLGVCQDDAGRLFDMQILRQ